MKQQVTAAMMTMPTNKAEDTPITRGMRSRSATGEGTQRGTLKVLEAERVDNCVFISLYCSLAIFKASVLPPGLLFHIQITVAKDDGAVQQPVLFPSNGQLCQQHFIFMNEATI